MAACPGCGRALPANGRCFYCGDHKVALIPGRRLSRPGAWLRKLVGWGLLLLLPAAAAFLFLTEPGKRLARRAAAALKITSDDDASPAVKLVRDRAPGIANLPGEVRFAEEGRDDGSIVVTVLHRHRDALTQAAFLVHPPSGTVRAMDAEAEKLMR
jgi:hypothetical protein